jgi:ABC-type glycerol-3-phosphate transport system substrate-binding protein
MKYFKLCIIAIATAAFMTACGQKDKTNTTAPTGQDAQKAAPVVNVVTAQAEDVDITNTFTSNV